MNASPSGGSSAEAVFADSLSNADLAPVSESDRTWSLWHFAALWVAMSVCIPTYMLSAGMVAAGMNWWQSLLAVLLGNAIVLVPMAVNGHAGARYGIPFPVYARASFGTRGAHVPALLRALVACGWFGIQTWIGGLALDVAFGIVWDGWSALGGGWEWMGYGVPEYLAFGLFWLMNMYFVWAGTESIKRLESWAAPVLLAMGVALLAWATVRAGGPTAVLGGADRLVGGEAGGAAGDGFPLGLFVPWLTAMVGFWATLALNIPDFTRYAKSQKDQAAGQAVGLLTTMPLFAFIGIAVTSATLVIWDEPIWNPIDVVDRIAAGGHPWIGFSAMVVVVLATLSTNIAANVVAPANAFANVHPRRIGFRAGGLIAGLIGIVILPWKLLDAYQTWLVGYSGLLGAAGGVLLADYLLVRRGRLSVAELYRTDGTYAYGSGVHGPAMIALGAGIAIAVAGLLHPDLRFLFDGAWFSAGIGSFLVYRALVSPVRG
ncbi:MAG: NCS1 family nucleobase:cation symporter-1 [Gemmatimonadota bacterium]|nr:NCS1 family nucleobase:cation symporter-1 [Gemmatimonadota bacterium]